MTVRTQPCEACPYRKDAPSGLWETHEYDKLIEYDKPTYAQPFESFACHATPGFLCNGWAVTHSNRGHEYELLALRLEPAEVPEPKVPLFSSGTEAAAHGKRDIKRPSRAARAMASRLMNRYSRLSDRTDRSS